MVFLTPGLKLNHQTVEPGSSLNGDLFTSLPLLTHWVIFITVLSSFGLSFLFCKIRRSNENILRTSSFEHRAFPWPGMFSNIQGSGYPDFFHLTFKKLLSLLFLNLSLRSSFDLGNITGVTLVSLVKNHHCHHHHCLTGKESICQHRRHRFNPCVEKISWRRKWQSTPIVLPGKSCGQSTLAGYSLWGCTESDKT